MTYLEVFCLIWKSFSYLSVTNFYCYSISVREYTYMVSNLTIINISKVCFKTQFMILSWLSVPCLLKSVIFFYRFLSAFSC